MMLLAVLFVCLTAAADAADLYSRAKEHLPWISKVRRTLHQIPELGFQEHKTSEHLQQWLKELDIDFKCAAGRATCTATLCRCADLPHAECSACMLHTLDRAVASLPTFPAH